jgi:phosphate starvation-inducible PhoH-like protein
LVNKTIVIEDVEPLLVYGFHDAHLLKVESAFPGTKITARGNAIRLEGENSDVDQIERIVTELALLVKRNGHLSDNDVETVLALFRKNPVATTREVGQRTNREAILNTPTGEVISAQTANQASLVHAARRSDVVFAIGPAGTG